MNLISYETIRAAHRAEKEDQLQKLPDDFFQSVKNWIEIKEKQRDSFSLLEVENAKKLLEDIINRRQRKLVMSALRTIRGELPPSNLTNPEREFFDKIVVLLKSYRENIDEKLKGIEKVVEEKIEETKEIIKDLKEPELKIEGKKILKILTDIPRFVGVDMQPYGPLKTGDVITLPEEIGNLLIQRRVAEELLE
jgi:DNA replication initiation complex subunit (GINS family)